MIDAFLTFVLYSLIPMLLPVGVSRETERVFFLLWSKGQLTLVAGLVAYLLWRASKAGRSTQLSILAWSVACLTFSLANAKIAWDAVVVYDRIAKLAVESEGLWAGFRDAGTGYVLGYPPGSSLMVVWGQVVGLPSTNMAHHVVMWLWMTNWLLHYVEPGRNWKSAPLFVLLFVLAPSVTWHLVSFYNNIVYALLWTTLAMAPLMGRSMKTWELSCHVLALVWFRPQFLLALVPLLSAGLIEWVLDGFRRERVKGFVLACAVAFAGVQLWSHEASALRDLQDEQQRLAEQAQLEGRDPKVLEIQFGSPALESTVATPQKGMRTRLSVYREAIPWAWRLALASYGVPLLALALMIASAWYLDKRFGVAAGVLLLTPLAFIVGTGEFGWGFSAYQNIPDSLRRLLLVVSPMTATFAVVLEDRVFRTAKQASNVPEQEVLGAAPSNAALAVSMRRAPGPSAPVEAATFPKRAVGRRARKRR